jgi:hypothetical protein
MQQMRVQTAVRSLRHAPQRMLLIVVLALHTLWLLAGAGAASAQRGATTAAPTGLLRVAVNVGNVAAAAAAQ